MTTLITVVIFLNNIILLFGFNVHKKHVVQYSSSSSSSYNTASLVKQMEVDIKHINHEQLQLKSKFNDLKIIKNKIQNDCNQEIEGIEQKRRVLLKSADKNLLFLNELLLRIHKEEMGHKTLEVEFNSYSTIFDLWQLKHDVILGDLQLLSGRRTNGTSERCRTVTAEVDAEEAFKNKARSAFFTRAMTLKRTRVSSETLKFNFQQKDLKHAESRKKILLTMLEKTKEAVKMEEKACTEKRAGANGLFQSTKEMLNTSEQSKDVLRSDLQVAQTYSQQLRQKSQSLKKLIKDWRQRVLDMVKALSQYRNDKKCYVKVDRYD